jgi:hypothetical protein
LGHGIHLAANSVGNVAPGMTVHLWDEVVGHLVRYAGVALVAAALAKTMIGRRRPASFGGYLLAVAVGLTWATNAVGGGTVVPSLLLAVAAVAFGWIHRTTLPIVFFVGFTPAVLLLTVELARTMA